MIDRLFDQDVGDTLRRAFAGPRPYPVLVEDVLERETAKRLTVELSSIEDWCTEYFIEEFLGGTRRVTADEFGSATTLERFATWQTISLLDGHLPRLLAPLLQVLASDELLAHLRTLGPSGIQSPRFKLRRYGPGDFFSPHTDGTTGIGVLFYFTNPPWQAGDGGRFIYEAPGAQRIYPPLFNSALLFPYRDDAPHHVEPVSPGGPIRFTLGCDYA